MLSSQFWVTQPPLVDNKDVLHGNGTNPSQGGQCQGCGAPVVNLSQEGQPQKDVQVDDQVSAEASNPKRYEGQTYPVVKSPPIYPSNRTSKVLSERKTNPVSEQTTEDTEGKLCLSPEALQEVRWMRSRINVSPVEVGESDGPRLSPSLVEEQCLPSLQGSFKENPTWKEQIDPQWVRVKAILDSGAARSIAPRDMAKGIRDDESDMS